MRKGLRMDQKQSRNIQINGPPNGGATVPYGAVFDYLSPSSTACFADQGSYPGGRLNDRYRFLDITGQVVRDESSNSKRVR